MIDCKKQTKRRTGWLEREKDGLKRIGKGIVEITLRQCHLCHHGVESPDFKLRYEAKIGNSPSNQDFEAITPF